MIEACEQCGALSHITNSRPSDNFRLRRRECSKCGNRWSTVEIRKAQYDRLAARKAWLMQLEKQLELMLADIREALKEQPGSTGL